MATSTNASSHRLQAVLLAGGVAVLAAPVLSAVGCAPGGSGEERAESPDQQALAAVQELPHKAVCAAAPAGQARCFARVRTEADGQTVKTFATPQGFGPADLQSAYAIAGTGTGTVAVIEAYDNPNVESDLAVYRSQFGLPACTTANGCFKKVNQSGQASPLPGGSTGWAGEMSLDVDMVSAGCPTCKIIVVEANSQSTSDLGAAVNTAASLGANAISNSYGWGESGADASADMEYYNHPGIVITASSGDSGYGAQYPAAGQYILSVGGTSLAKSTSSRGWAEGAWSSGGSGCSAYTPKPSFQTDTGCGKRTEADVSAVADPSTGVAVYQTYGGGGWEVYGGTSASAPLVAAILVGAGKGSITNGWPYANTGSFYDVTTGSNGTCSPSYLCTAGAGYDGPTGWGTPNGAAIAGGGSGSSSSGTTSSSSSSSTSSTSSSSSSSGKSSSSSSSSSSGGSSGNPCSHYICDTGAALSSICDPCAAEICKQSPSCCTTAWTEACVDDIKSICGETCPGGSGSSSSSSSSSSTSSGGTSGNPCSHYICDTGAALSSICDPCAAKICEQSPSCCTTGWTQACVADIKSICGETCP